MNTPESDLKSEIRRGEDFFAVHKQIFPEKGRCDIDYTKRHGLFNDAREIKMDLNRAVRAMIKQGGIMPPLLLKANHLNEDLGLVYRRDHEEFFTLNKVLGQGGIIETKGTNFSIQEWFAIRSVLIRRWVENGKIMHGPGLAMNDILHFNLSPKKKRNKRDMGWVNPDITEEQIKSRMKDPKQIVRGIRSEVEGLIRRHFRIGEMARIISNGGNIETAEGYYKKNKEGKDIEEEHKGALTMIAELRGERAIREGRLPIFFYNAICFGEADITQPLDHEERLDEIKERIRDEIERTTGMSGKDRIVQCIRAELVTNIIKNSLRGGRKGTNPSDLYELAS